MIDTRPKTLKIRTPEGVTFTYTLAGPFRRFLAWLIDTAAVSAATMLLSTILMLGKLISADFITGVTILSAFVFYMGYNMVLEWAWRGQTLGKFVLKVRVIDIRGLRLQFSQIAMRNLLRLVDMIPLTYLVGLISLWWSPLEQRLGDLAANTVVITNHAAPLPDITPLLPEKYNSFRDYPHLEARLRQHTSPELRTLITQALLRKEILEPKACLSLYAELVAVLKEDTPFPEAATFGLSDERYLRNALESLTSQK